MRRKYDEFMSETQETSDGTVEKLDTGTEEQGYETQMAEKELKVFREFFRVAEECRKNNGELVQGLSLTNEQLKSLLRLLCSTGTDSLKLNMQQATEEMRKLESTHQDIKNLAISVDSLNRQLKDTGSCSVVPFKVQIYWLVIMVYSILFGSAGFSKLVMAVLGRTWAVIAIGLMLVIIVIGILQWLAMRRNE